MELADEFLDSIDTFFRSPGVSRFAFDVEPDDEPSLALGFQGAPGEGRLQTEDKPRTSGQPGDYLAGNIMAGLFGRVDEHRNLSRRPEAELMEGLKRKTGFNQ